MCCRNSRKLIKLHIRVMNFQLVEKKEQQVEEDVDDEVTVSVEQQCVFGQHHSSYICCANTLSTARSKVLAQWSILVLDVKWQDIQLSIYNSNKNLLLNETSICWSQSCFVSMIFFSTFENDQRRCFCTCLKEEKNTRSSANVEKPCEHTVSWNRVKYCTYVRRIAFENVCNR